VRGRQTCSSSVQQFSFHFVARLFLLVSGSSMALVRQQAQAARELATAYGQQRRLDDLFREKLICFSKDKEMMQMTLRKTS
jgi:hypothetical protein